MRPNGKRSQRPSLPASSKKAVYSFDEDDDEIWYRDGDYNEKGRSLNRSVSGKVRGGDGGNTTRDRGATFTAEKFPTPRFVFVGTPTRGSSAFNQLAGKFSTKTTKSGKSAGNSGRTSGGGGGGGGGGSGGGRGGVLSLCRRLEPIKDTSRITVKSTETEAPDGTDTRLASAAISGHMSLGLRDYKLKLPLLTPYQVLRYKYSQGHMFCLDMLIEGHHRSFAVLFNLMRRQQKEYKEAEGNSCLKMQSLLENDPQKLAKVSKELTEAERKQQRELKMSKKDTFRYKEGCLLAGTVGAHLSSYNASLRLGRYFRDIGDIYLARNFISDSLTTAEKLCLLETKKASAGVDNDEVSTNVPTNNFSTINESDEDHADAGPNDVTSIDPSIKTLLTNNAFGNITNDASGIAPADDASENTHTDPSTKILLTNDASGNITNNISATNPADDASKNAHADSSTIALANDASANAVTNDVSGIAPADDASENARTDASTNGDSVDPAGYACRLTSSMRMKVTAEEIRSRRIADSLLELCLINDVDPQFEHTIENLHTVLERTNWLLKESGGRPWVRDGVSYETEALRRNCIAHMYLGKSHQKPPHVDSAKALRHFRSALEAVEKTRDRSLEAKVHWSLARQLMEEFRWSEAVDPLRSCEGTFVLFGRALDACDAKVALARCFRCTGFFERGREMLKLAVSSARRNGYVEGMIQACFEMSLLDMTEGESGERNEAEAMEDAEWRMRRAYLLTRDLLTKSNLVCVGPGEEVGEEIPDRDPPETTTIKDEREEMFKQEFDVRLDTASARSSYIAAQAAFHVSEQTASDKRRKRTIHNDLRPRTRVAYGILSAVGLLPALVDVVRKSPVEDVRAEVSAMINWKNNGMMDVKNTELPKHWKSAEDDHFSIYSEEGLVGKRLIEGLEPLRVIRQERVDETFEVIESDVEEEVADGDSVPVAGKDEDGVNASFIDLMEVLIDEKLSS